MSPHPDESGPEPDDRLFVRPYVAVSDGPSGSAYPAWPSGPAFPEPDHVTEPLPVVPPAPAPPASPRRAAREQAGAARRGSRLPLAVLALLALAGGAGTLAFLMSGPAPEPAPASLHPDLAVPALPARSPGAGEPSVRSRAATGTPPASATARTPSATPSSAKPATSPPGAGKPSPKPAAGTSRTLRPGDRGPDVSALQERLYGQGFTYVSVTGVYDGQTKRGVAQLQRDRDIQGDPKGVYGPATQAAFG